MLYSMNCTTPTADCALKPCVPTSSPKRKNVLARAIALTLLAGSLVVPAWAATVSGIKFDDLNDDGHRDTQEPPVVSELVLIKNEDNDAFFYVQTGSDGSFSFVGLVPGNYTIWSGISEGWHQTTPTRGDGFVTHSFILSQQNISMDIGINNGVVQTASCRPATVKVNPQLPNKTGDWFGSNTWVDANTGSSRVPPALGDNVLIEPGYTVTVLANIDLGTSSLKGELCNQGILRLGSTEVKKVKISADSVYNKGSIFGNNGKDVIRQGPGNWAYGWSCPSGSVAGAGTSIEVNATRFTNAVSGKIEAGNGGIAPKGQGTSCLGWDDVTQNCGDYVSTTGGNGGSVDIKAGIAINEGIIKSGNGGASQALHQFANGGKGGYVYFSSSVMKDIKLDILEGYNSGYLISGDGGASCAYGSLTNPGSGGGATVILTVPGGKITGGKGAERFIWDPIKLEATTDLHIDGFDFIDIYTDEGGTMDFTKLSDGAISANKVITISTKSLDGKGGQIDLRGVNKKAFKAGEKIEIFADEILTDTGVTIADLVDSPSVTVLPGKVMYRVELSADFQVTGEPNSAVAIPIKVINAGPKTDTYTFNVSDSAGWNLGTLAPITVDGLSTAESALSITLPMNRGNTDVITITATSQADPTIIFTATTHASVNLGVDSDGDNSPDSLDDFPTDPKEWLDSDKDGIGNNSDTDNDNDDMPDAWEINYDKLNPFVNDASQDPDDDGFSNTEEYKAGTNPVDPTSKPVVVEPEKVALTISKVGEGLVTAQGIDCGEDCTEDFALNTEVKLLATPAEGYEFANWSGDCATDTLTMDTAKNCAANFKQVVIEPPPPVVGKYTAHGTLKDKAGNALAGVTVQIGDKTTVTDGAGNWEIGELLEGTYEVIAAKEGFACLTSDVELGNQQYLQAVNCEPVTSLKAKLTNQQWGAIPQGQNLSYTVTLFNGGETAATGIKLAGKFPDRVTIAKFEGDTSVCDSATATCTVADLAPGTTATLSLELSNLPANGQAFMNALELVSNEYPADVVKSWRKVKPYLSLLGKAIPNPVVMGGKIHYALAAELLNTAPELTAKAVKAEIRLPNELKFLQATTAQGTCENVGNTITCNLGDLSVENSDSISRVDIRIDAELGQDLVQLNAETKMTASNYPEHHEIVAVNTILGDGKVDGIILLDVTASMGEELQAVINAVKAKLNQQFENAAQPVIALVTFRDSVKIEVISDDLTTLLKALEKLEAKDGGTCPEASAQALDLALDHIKPNGTIIFVTDAPPYEGTDIEALKAKIVAKQANFVPIVTTSDCATNQLSSPQQ